MTLLVHLLQYQLHLSEINDTDYQSNYWHITTVIQVMYTFAQKTVDPRISAPRFIRNACIAHATSNYIIITWYLPCTCNDLKRKRVVLSLENKLTRLVQGEMMTKLAKEYNVGNSTQI